MARDGEGQEQQATHALTISRALTPRNGLTHHHRPKFAEYGRQGLQGRGEGVAAAGLPPPQSKKTRCLPVPREPGPAEGTAATGFEEERGEFAGYWGWRRRQG